MDGQRETRKRETADAQREKKDEHLKLLTMSRTILIYKNYKKFIIITPSKNLCKLPLMILKQQCALPFYFDRTERTLFKRINFLA